MGGFHGGHSHHSGGFHGGGHYHHHSHYGSHQSAHTVENGLHYINGKRYYGAYYGTFLDKPVTYVGAMALWIIFLISGLITLAFGITVTTTATVTQTWLAHDYTDYEQYEFTYTVLDKTYKGYGDDDISYTYSNSVNEDGLYSNNKSYVFTVKEGEQYPIKARLLDPTHYEFISPNESGTEVINYIVGSILTFIGLIMILQTISAKKKHQALLDSIGDANGDGIVNDYDIEYKETMEKAKRDKKAQEFFNKKPTRKCPFCDTLLDWNARYCDHCGGNLG